MSYTYPSNVRISRKLSFGIVANFGKGGHLARLSIASSNISTFDSAVQCDVVSCLALRDGHV